MIGFCLAAGAGSRLAPLTEAVPKPLVRPAGRPLLDLALEALRAAGAGRVVVNAHHHADQLAAHLAGRPDVEVTVEPVLLGTGGALGGARHAGLLGADLDEVILLTCADVLVDPADLARLAGFLDHTSAAMVAGLVVAPPNPLRLRLDGDRVVSDPAGRWGSAAVYALRATVLDGVAPAPATFMDALLGPLMAGGAVTGLPLAGPWLGVDTLPRLLAASAGLLAGRWPYQLPPGQLLTTPGGGGARGGGRRPGARGPVFLVEGARVDPTALLAGPVVVDAGARVGPEAVVTRAVVAPDAEVGAGAVVAGSVLGPGARLAPGVTAAAALVPGTGTAR